MRCKLSEDWVYKTYANYLRDKYGEKVYKLPINLPITCPNRDCNIGKGGCTFCGEEGGSFENQPNILSVKEQISKNKSHIEERYKAKKFIAYFQNFSNTYMPLDRFKNYMNQAVLEDIVGISVSTRPDCINEDYLIFLRELSEESNLDITIELGLQTVNYHSLQKINRGHTLAEFIDAVIRIKKYGFRVCTHIILNLPWDNMEDTIESAKILSSLNIDEVKLHSLYLVKGTVMANQYLNKEFQMISKDEYVERVIKFLEYLNPDIVIQRIIGRAPEEESIFTNWDTSWWKIRDEIVNTMKARKTYQGRSFNYLNGKALHVFNN